MNVFFVLMLMEDNVVDNVGYLVWEFEGCIDMLYGIFVVCGGKFDKCFFFLFFFNNFVMNLS